MEHVDSGRLRARVLGTAALGAVLLAFGLLLRWSGLEPTQAFERDLSPASRGVSAAQGPVLHVALIAFTIADAAVLDAVSYPMAVGEAFDLEIGFRVPPELQLLASRFGGYSGFGSQGEWLDRIRSSRALPATFGRLQAHLQLTGVYLGEHQGLSGVRIDELSGHHYSYGTGGGGGGTWHLPADDVLMRVREPVVRLDLSRGNALFLMLSDPNDPTSFDPGQRDMWLSAFEAAGAMLPSLPNAALVEVLDSEPAAGERRAQHLRFAPLGFGPAAELVAAAFVLHDAERAAAGIAELRQGDALERAFAGAARTHDVVLQDFYEEHYCGPRRGLTTALVHGTIDDFQVRGHELTLLTVLADARPAALLVDRLLKKHLQHDVRSVVLAEEELSATAEVEAQYQRLRAGVIADLPLPWGVVLRSAWLLAIWLLLVPMVALVFVLVTRPAHDGSGRACQLSPLQVTLLAIFTFVTLGNFSLATLLVPVWWGLARRWLRAPLDHGVAERAIVWLALSLVTIEGFRRVGWFVEHEWMTAAGQFGQLFCWCLVGLIVAHDSGWRRPERLAWFLAGLFGLQAWWAFGSEGEVGPLRIAVFGLTLLAFIGFVRGGRHAPDLEASCGAAV